MSGAFKYAIAAWVAFIVLGAAGCASVSVTDVKQAMTVGVPGVKPALIAVAPFATDPGTFNVDRTGAELTDFQDNLQKMLMAALVADIRTHLAPSQVVYGTPPAGGNYWVVTGTFVRVNQGSRFLRSAIGFGAGGTKMETAVVVYNMSGSQPTPFLTFATTGGSGAEPGAVVAADPVSVALNAVGGAAKGLTGDTKRTSRMITAALSDYMYGKGWISADQKLTPKTPF